MTRISLHRPFLFKHHQNGLQQNLQIQPDAPLIDIACIQPHDFLEVQHIAPAVYLPHTGDAGLGRQSHAVTRLIEPDLFLCRRAGTHEAHIASLCQLRNNFFSKISHKAQYYQLTLKISTKKEPLISQKSQTLRFYLYSISPNCTILA